MEAFFIFEKKRHMNTVAVHLAKGFEEIEAISIIDVLRRAGVEVTVASIEKSLEVTGAHNIIVKADILFEDVKYETIDMIVLPGGMPGSTNLNNHKELKKQILNFNNQGKPLGAICAAPLVFGNLGILKGKKATCYPGFEGELIGAEPVNSSVEKDGTIVTGKGAGVAIHFALKIVEMLKGKDLADELALKMIVAS